MRRWGLLPFSYGDAGYFLRDYPRISKQKYTFGNWGARLWEYCYAESILNECGIRDKAVIDIGIGLPSQYSFYQFYIQSGCRLFGIDPDVRLPLETRLADGCIILRQSAEVLPMNDASIDVVVAISSLEHFPSMVFRKALAEINRVLKPSGKIVITLDETFDRNRPSPWAILERSLNGFSAVECNDLLPNSARLFTMAWLLEFLSPFFHTEHIRIYNVPSAPNGERLHYLQSVPMNSIISYCCLTKRNN
jgi:ubiquinone/menaquinone biosynthesis C-methylase UbiE